MRIIAIKDASIDQYTFRIDSLEYPDEIIVVRPNGKCLSFQNRPPRIVKYVKKSWLPWASPDWKEVDMKWTCDHRHFIRYSCDTRDATYADLDSQSPLWRTVFWQQFDKHEHFGIDALVWDFVNQREIRFSVFNPVTLYADHRNLEECTKYAFEKNCQPLVDLECALVKRLVEADEQDKVASMSTISKWTNLLTEFLRCDTLL